MQIFWPHSLSRDRKEQRLLLESTVDGKTGLLTSEIGWESILNGTRSKTVAVPGLQSH